MKIGDIVKTTKFGLSYEDAVVCKIVCMDRSTITGQLDFGVQHKNVTWWANELEIVDATSEEKLLFQLEN